MLTRLSICYKSIKSYSQYSRCTVPGVKLSDQFMVRLVTIDVGRIISFLYTMSTAPVVLVFLLVLQLSWGIKCNIFDDDRMGHSLDLSGLDLADKDHAAILACVKKSSKPLNWM
jgi:nitrogen fixation-related uncharacterized protein